VRSVATARWPKLTQLVFGYGKRSDGSTPRDLAPIFDGAGLPSLTHLALRGLPFADEVVTMLRSAKLLPQLRTLDLSNGELTSSGAEMLVGMASALAGLEDLDLSGNELPRRAISALQSTFGDRLFVDTEGDENPTEDDDGEARYDEIDE